MCDCDGNTLDECGVCDGPGAIYECGCEGLPETEVSNGCDLPDNTIYLLDDGDEEVSGDIKKGDNIYTRKVAFPSYATTSSLEWKFRAQDWQSGFADSIITVTVQ